MAQQEDELPNTIASVIEALASEMGVVANISQTPRPLQTQSVRAWSAYRGVASVSDCPACSNTGLGSMSLEQAHREGLIITSRWTHHVLIICPRCIHGQERMRLWRRMPAEGEGIRLDNGSLQEVPDQDQAYAAIQWLLEQRCGWLTLAGGYGVGKSMLLYATLNHLSADYGLHGRYLTAPDLLTQLRDGIGETTGISGRLKELIEMPVLAVDELDKFNPTEFAAEKLFQLFNERYQARAKSITLLGFNADRASRIPPFLRSRMADARFRLVMLQGRDLRRVMWGGDDEEPIDANDTALDWTRGEQQEVTQYDPWHRGADEPGSSRREVRPTW
jgi:DNA replication protein DnaC